MKENREKWVGGVAWAVRRFVGLITMALLRPDLKDGETMNEPRAFENSTEDEVCGSRAGPWRPRIGGRKGWVSQVGNGWDVANGPLRCTLQVDPHGPAQIVGHADR